MCFVCVWLIKRIGKERVVRLAALQGRNEWVLHPSIHPHTHPPRKRLPRARAHLLPRVAFEGVLPPEPAIEHRGDGAGDGVQDGHEDGHEARQPIGHLHLVRARALFFLIKKGGAGGCGLLGLDGKGKGEGRSSRPVSLRRSRTSADGMISPKIRMKETERRT